MKVVNREYKLYELDELKPEARDRAIAKQVQFEIEYITEDSPYYHCAVEMEELRTPWFLAEAILESHFEDIVTDIKNLQHLFFANGELIPANLYPKKGE